MRVFLKLVAVTTFAAISTVAHAQAQPITVKFQSGPSSPAVTGYGYYIGPFSGTVTSNPTLPTINLFCVDVLNAVGWGKQWRANVTNLGFSDISNTRHGNAKLDYYRMAAWLTRQYAVNSTTEWAGIQAAVWQVLNPGAPWGQSAEMKWVWAATNFAKTPAWKEYDWNDYYVITPVEAAGHAIGHGPQEFITTSPHVTPEPETLLLVGTGFLAFVGFAVVRGIRV